METLVGVIGFALVTILLLAVGQRAARTIRYVQLVSSQSVTVWSQVHPDLADLDAVGRIHSFQASGMVPPSGELDLGFFLFVFTDDAYLACVEVGWRCTRVSRFEVSGRSYRTVSHRTNPLFPSLEIRPDGIVLRHFRKDGRRIREILEDHGIERQQVV